MNAPQGSAAHGKAISARTIALIVDPVRLHRLRWQYAHDPQVQADLDALAGIALAHHTGTSERTEIVIADTRKPPSEMTTDEAAKVAGVGVRAIQRAIAEGRITATKRAGRQWIDPEDLAHYAAHHRQGARAWRTRETSTTPATSPSPRRRS